MATKVKVYAHEVPVHSFFNHNDIGKSHRPDVVYFATIIGFKVSVDKNRLFYDLKGRSWIEFVPEFKYSN